jgi:hypothetical protein
MLKTSVFVTMRLREREGWKVLLHGLKRAVCDIPRKFVLRISLYNITLWLSI